MRACQILMAAAVVFHGAYCFAADPQPNSPNPQPETKTGEKSVNVAKPPALPTSPPAGSNFGQGHGHSDGNLESVPPEQE